MGEVELDDDDLVNSLSLALWPYDHHRSLPSGFARAFSEVARFTGMRS